MPAPDAMPDREETESIRFKVGGREFSFFRPRSLDPFVDPEQPLDRFPLWTKIWEPALLLADYLSGTPPVEEHMLELGCGLGTVGIVAAAFGHRVTMTDGDPESLKFARLNAARNLPPEAPLEVMKLEWTNPRFPGTFECIMGAEIAYNQEAFEPLHKIFRSRLKPGGRILLAESLRPTSVNFFSYMEAHFNLRARKRTLRSGEGSTTRVILCEMTEKG